VLDRNGSGSVRHIWSTWSIPGDDLGCQTTSRFTSGWSSAANRIRMASPDLGSPVGRQAHGARFTDLPGLAKLDE
jgi:hypothetical protein